MSLTGPEIPVPTEVQTVTVVLKDWLATDERPAGQSVNYELVLLDQNGRRIRWPQDAGNLVPHLTPTQITQLQAFMVAMRTLAEEILP